MRMRITYSSCKLLILSVKKLTKAYKVNRIAIHRRRKGGGGGQGGQMPPPRFF